MTYSPDARTPSASVHALSGSTPPGGPATLQPFAIRTVAAANLDDTFLPLGGAAADVVAGLVGRRPAADPDADLIALAERVAALATREERLVMRESQIEDEIQAASPPYLPMPERPGAATLDLQAVDGVVVQTCVLRTGAAEAVAYEDAKAAREARIAEIEAFVDREAERRGLPEMKKRRRHMYRRLARWAGTLAEMEAQTAAGVKAKAAAQVAIEKGGSEDTWTRALAASVSRDALRLVCHEADARAELDRQADGALLALEPAWEASCLRVERADEAHDAASDRYQHPDFPEGLLCRDADRTGLGPYPRRDVRTGVWIFGDGATIAVLRASLASGHGSARHAEIVQAYDEWQAAEAAEEERSGLAAARAEDEEALKEARNLRQRICLTLARTTAGIAFKMRVALWCLGGIDGLAEDIRSGEVGDPGSDDVLALSVLLDIARQRALAQVEPAREDVAA